MLHHHPAHAGRRDGPTVGQHPAHLADPGVLAGHRDVADPERVVGQHGPRQVAGRRVQDDPPGIPRVRPVGAQRQRQDLTRIAGHPLGDRPPVRRIGHRTQPAGTAEREVRHARPPAGAAGRPGPPRHLPVDPGHQPLGAQGGAHHQQQGVRGQELLPVAEQPRPRQVHHRPAQRRVPAGQHAEGGEQVGRPRRAPPAAPPYPGAAGAAAGRRRRRPGPAAPGSPAAPAARPGWRVWPARSRCRRCPRAPPADPPSSRRAPRTPPPRPGRRNRPRR